LEPGQKKRIQEKIYLHVNMVLLSNENHMIIKKNHLLKCLEQKKQSFKIFIEPLKEKVAMTPHCDDNKELKCMNLTDNDITMIFHSK